MQVLGSGEVTITLAASANRPEREIVLKSGAFHDLTALRRAALARQLPAFPAKELAPAKVDSGSLVIVGGGGMPKDVMEKFIELAGGPDGSIVVLPTATPATGQDESGAGRLLQTGRGKKCYRPFATNARGSGIARICRRP